MTLITFEDGKVVMRDDEKVGTEQACCCDQPCDCGSPGRDPLVSPVSGRGLVWLEFQSCIGSGATATVDAPEATSVCDYDGTGGPITGVTLTSGGSGYALLGRVEPTVTAAVAGGSGATFAVTLAQQTEYLGETACLEVPYWHVSSVSVTAGGTGYSDAQPVTFSESAGDTEVLAAKAYAYVGTDEPQNETVVITSTSGTGATLSPTWTEIGTTPRVSVAGCAPPAMKLYEVAGFTISGGGSGYAVDDVITVDIASASDGTPIAFAFCAVDAVDGTGAITAVRVDSAGEYAGSLTDVIETVVVESCVTNGRGKYYREDPSEPPYVSAVTVTVNQGPPGTGSGAVVTATVEDDTSSPDFGEIVSLSLDDGGTGYLDIPDACGSLDTLYVTTPFEQVTVPSRFAGLPGTDGFGDEGFIGTMCVNDYFDPGPNPGDSGSIALAEIWTPGVYCGSDNSVYLQLALTFLCSMRVSPTRVINNFGRDRIACLKFELDGDGCPVGDAQLVCWETYDRVLRATNLNGTGLEFIAPCDGYTEETCPCDSTCDDEFLPVISFMP